MIEERQILNFIPPRLDGIQNNDNRRYMVVTSNSNIIQMINISKVEGKEHKMFKSCLGDYIAIAIKNKNIKYKRYGKELLANHSGLTKEEIFVPLIIKYIK